MASMIIYCSKYGSTKAYAEKIAKDMGWEVRSYKNLKMNELKEAEALVLASNVRIGKMGLKGWSKSHADIIKPKLKAAICVGGASADDQDYYKEVIEKNLDFLDLKKEQVFGLGGRQFISEYKGFDAFLFKMLDKMVKDSKEKKSMLENKDHINMKDVDAIVEYLKK